MEEQVLSVEQMQELIDMGIDTSKASICWLIPRLKGEILLHICTEKDEWEYIEKTFMRYPTFTLQDVLKMLPNSIKFAQLSGILTIKKDSMNYYQVQYKDFIKEYNIQQFVEKSLLDATFNMLKWCKQNNYI